MQLELDASLPVPVITFLRLDLDYRLRQLDRLGTIQRGIRRSTSISPFLSSAIISPSSTTPRHGPVLLIGIAHGEGFKPLMGASSVAAVCRLCLLSSTRNNGPGGSTERVVESGPCRYESASHVAHWYSMFMFDLPEDMYQEEDDRPLLQVRV